ncbi:GNAT family N-acetyltransferase [Chryseobacterium sp. 6424]|uniref:GNAT family N-acetyltransferase n=1 Tax=Chryseobacterium sp. 6424 TaxID=2039166 RepID=UPI0013CEF943|nr:GNAT family N-acetyltransferase [Chryseobacterium sp. 6424]
MKKISIHDNNEFLDFLNDKIDRNDFRYKYLIPVLDMVFGIGQVPITENTTIFTHEKSWVIYIETHGQLFLYGENFEIFIDELSEIISFQNFKGFEIMGDYTLVYSLLEKKNITNYTVIKDRIFYSLNNTDKLTPSFNETKAENQDCDEITQMMLDYYVEEYKGLRNKTVEQINPAIVEHINTNSIIINKENNVIRAFCTINDPDIGIIYVKPEYRNQNIGKQLLSSASEQLFKQNGCCYLMTDLINEASNKMCIDVGYFEIYKHTNIEL